MSSSLQIEYLQITFYLQIEYLQITFYLQIEYLQITFYLQIGYLQISFYLQIGYLQITSSIIKGYCEVLIQDYTGNSSIQRYTEETSRKISTTKHLQQPVSSWIQYRFRLAGKLELCTGFWTNRERRNSCVRWSWLKNYWMSIVFTINSIMFAFRNLNLHGESPEHNRLCLCRLFPLKKRDSYCLIGSNS